MNQDFSRLKQLKDHIIGLEMRLTIIQSDIFAIDKDIRFLEDLVAVLRENIDILKSDKIITVASEYKKAIEELGATNKNLEYYSSLKERLNRDFDKYEKIREVSLFEFENLRKQVDSCRVVLSFDPSKRKNER